MIKSLITSEYLSYGHLDRIADKINENVMKACLERDEFNWLTCDTLITDKTIIISGEVSNEFDLDLDYIVKDVLFQINSGYKDIVLDHDNCTVINLLKLGSAKITDEVYANGYACKETESLIQLSKELAKKIVEKVSKSKKIKIGKRTEMKSEVTIDYSNVEKPMIHSITLSIQHDSDFDMSYFNKYVIDNIIEPLIKLYKINLANSDMNNGLDITISGNMRRVGMSGKYNRLVTDGNDYEIPIDKEPRNIEKIAATMARFLAKEIVNKDFAKRCYIQLTYQSNNKYPVEIYVDAFKTNKVSEKKIYDFIEKHDLSIAGIIELLDLRAP